MLEEVRREFADTDVVFLAVSLDPDVPSVKGMTTRLGIGMTLLMAKGEVMGPLRVGHVPSTVFIDRRGMLVAAVQGPRSAAFFTRRLRAILPG